MGGIGNGGDQGRIDHGGACPEQDTRNEPPGKALRGCRQKETTCLNPHASHDQAFAAPAVAERSGNGLEDAPDSRIYGLENSDSLHSEPEGIEEQGEDSPAHAIVQVVDETCLGGCKEVSVSKGGAKEHLPE